MIKRSVEEDLKESERARDWHGGKCCAQLERRSSKNRLSQMYIRPRHVSKGMWACYTCLLPAFLFSHSRSLLISLGKYLPARRAHSKNMFSSHEASFTFCFLYLYFTLCVRILFVVFLEFCAKETKKNDSKKCFVVQVVGCFIVSSFALSVALGRILYVH